jgi:hypothetical protein
VREASKLIYEHNKVVKIFLRSLALARERKGKLKDKEGASLRRGIGGRGGEERLNED